MNITPLSQLISTVASGREPVRRTNPIPLTAANPRLDGPILIMGGFSDIAANVWMPLFRHEVEDVQIHSFDLRKESDTAGARKAISNNCEWDKTWVAANGDSINDALEETPAGVLVATPPSEHFNAIRALRKAGYTGKIAVEKPPGGFQGVTTWDKVITPDKKILTTDTTAINPALNYVINGGTDGEKPFLELIGDLHAMKGRYLTARFQKDKLVTMLTDRPNFLGTANGGSLTDTGYYPLNAITRLLMAKGARLSDATVENLIFSNMLEDQFREHHVDTYAYAKLKLASENAGSNNSDIDIEIDCGFVPDDEGNRRDIEVYGENGVIGINFGNKPKATYLSHDGKDYFEIEFNDKEAEYEERKVAAQDRLPVPAYAKYGIMAIGAIDFFNDNLDNMITHPNIQREAGQITMNTLRGMYLNASQTLNVENGTLMFNEGLLPHTSMSDIGVPDFRF